VASWLKEERYAVPFLFVFLFLLYFPFLGWRDLWAPVEPRYGEIARVMFNQGEWFVPTVNGTLYTDKPILYFWFVLFFSNLTGGVTEWSLRLPSALSAAGLVFLTYLFGRDFFNRSVGLLASLIFATSALVAWEARWAHTDMLFTFFFTLSLYFFFRVWTGKGGWVEALSAYATMALATLTKGMIGFVLPGLIVGIYWLLTAEWSKIRYLHLPTGTLIFVLIAAPWFIAIFFRTDGIWLEEFFWKHHVERFLGGLKHRKPFYYYLLNFPLGFFPWTLFLLPAGLASFWRNNKRKGSPVLLFFAIWFIVVFLFFSFSEVKRLIYLLPLFPPASLFVGYYLTTLEKSWGPSVSLLHWILLFFLVVLALGGISFPLIAWKYFPEVLLGSFILGAGYVAGSTLALYSVHRELWNSVVSCVAGIVLFGILCVNFWVLPVINEFKSPRLFAAAVRKVVHAERRIYIYADTMHDFNFYLKRAASGNH